MAVTDWGGANLRFLALVSVGAVKSLDQNGIETVCHQNNPSNDVKYITQMQIVLVKKKWKCT